MRRTKLVCTVGPATATAERVRALAETGTDVFRVNLSHGDPQEHAAMVRLVRQTSQELGAELAVMADLPGPKIRLGPLVRQPLRLEAGERFVLRADPGPGDATGAPTTHPGLAADVLPGDRILLSDGAVELTVVGTEGSAAVTEVVRAGHVRSGAGVNVPAERLSLPAITDRDREGLHRVLELGVDLVAQSFVRGGRDVLDLRSLMGARPVPIVAKVETRPAVDGFGELLEATDAVMVARGDLGVELPMEEIPILQKTLLRAARAAGRPAIVATQMLESMTHAPRPTRAEATDVANAVLDGTDAIMLSGETAIGEYPLEAALAAVRIAEAADRSAEGFRLGALPRERADEATAVARAAAQIAADDPAVVAISCFTRTGRTASLLSCERPSVPIYAFVPEGGARRALALRWGVRALPAHVPADTDEMIRLMDEGLRSMRLAEPGRSVVMVASSPAGKAHTNMLKVHRIGGTAS